jgi:hypothetical protein
MKTIRKATSIDSLFTDKTEAPNRELRLSLVIRQLTKTVLEKVRRVDWQSKHLSSAPIPKQQTEISVSSLQRNQNLSRR